MDREFVIMFTLVDENQSWYLDENIRHFCTDPDSVNKEDAVFQRSNKMHGKCLPCSQIHTSALCSMRYNRRREEKWNVEARLTRCVT